MKTRYQKSSESLKKFYQTEEGIALRKQKSKSISKARLVNSQSNLKEADVLMVEEVLSWGYVLDRDLIMKHSGTGKAAFALLYHIRHNRDWWEEKSKNICRFVPRRIQSQSVEMWNQLLIDIPIITFDKVMKMYGFKSIGGFKNFCTRMGLVWKNKDHWITRETKPEQIARMVLESLNQNFYQQKCFNDSKFRADIFIKPNKIIEIHGDYWHANPDFYDYSNLTKMQQKNILRDVIKKQWFIDNGFEFLCLWEYDLKNKIDQEIEKIKNFIK